MKTNQAFTLIELLVVVLIIGVLAAVALPQYSKAVEKARATQAITLLKTVFKAAESYYLSNGKWPTQFEQLDVQIPWTGSTKYFTHSYITDTLSNDTWSIQLYGGIEEGVIIGRLTGYYQGGGFAIFNTYGSHATLNEYRHQILCNELFSQGVIFSQNEGAYCKKIFKSPAKIYEGAYLRYFKIP